ncbi:ABC transporter substrate-binding protein [Balneolaceae bacterium YR4-1]|uniref:ABC transporter substrate-binding protein n=1 Tax=Halalkalibaculum roseum TaxID=2709311 RepID=A0A6M1SR72_9BACT|nr:helical backbone metal receptor [Halalkalibaculum roseum]NGP75310.1 ABC transporter substrate-binding protein [Halalkalibaculum roseum]
MANYERIISLVPSLTELLIDLGLEEQLVGRTRFCVHPKEKVKDIPIIGGTKNPRLDKIRAADPDYIVANKEENKKDHINELREDFEVKVTDISTIEDALITIHELGKELGVENESEKLIRQINEAMDEIPEEPPLRTAYLIWKDPYMTVGKDTYIHNVMKHWKLDNVFGDKTRYPKVSFYDITEKAPELILLSSEPYPFKEKHLAEFEEAFPNTRVLLAEGEWFSWYGSHMLHSFRRLNVWRKAIA